MKISHIARACSEALGSSKAFISAVTLILIWAVAGPFFHYSEAWQLIANTFTTIVTFLFVFLIQNTQNADTKAIQMKLDELISMSEARDDFMQIEKLDSDELQELDKMHEKGLDNTKPLWYTRRQ